MVKVTSNLGHPVPYDPSFTGPLKNRSCTDVVFFVFFVIFLGVWGLIGFYAISKGDISTLLVPKDSNGQRCGLDESVKDKPYVFFFDLTKCLGVLTLFKGCDTPQICVKKCPSSFYNYRNGYNLPANSIAYCKNGERPIKEFDEDECAKWHLPSTQFQNRCIPSSLNQKTVDELQGAIEENVKLDNFEKAISNVKLLSEAEQVGKNIVEDVVRSWWKILLGILIGLIICIIYIVMLRWIAPIMVWVSIIALVAGLGYATVFAGLKVKEFHQKVKFSHQLEIDVNKQSRNFWLVTVISLAILFILTVLLLVFLRKRIPLAIALIKESGKAVNSVTSVLFFPIFPWVLQVSVIAYVIIVAMYLAGTREPIYTIQNCSKEQNNIVCNPKTFMDAQKPCSEAVCKFLKMDNPRIYVYLQGINLLGFFWLAFFVSALGEMILASVFAQWYWTFDKRKLPFFAVTESTFRVLRYHIGTLAFGSLIIAICRMIRLCLEYIEYNLKKYDNVVTRAILCCLKCFFWCLEKFLRFINKNAYIMCAIYGKNFCTSAKNSFFLLMRNILRVVVLDKITDFLFFVSKLMVTIGVGSISYVIFATDLTSFDNSGLHYKFVPVGIIMIFTYIIASVFFKVYHMAVNTLFLCFLEDCERNDGSTSKPYYMSKNLMRILGKKNKNS